MPISIHKTHASQDGSPVQSHHTYEAPASGQLRIVALNDGPGFYNIHATTQNHRSGATLAYNSHKEGAPSYDLQFAFVVRENGSLYSDIAKVGGQISLPGPEA